MIPEKAGAFSGGAGEAAELRSDKEVRATAKGKTIQEEFYRRKQWQECRNAYMHKVNGICERCYAKGHLRPADIVHHKIHLTPENYRDPSISLNFENLEALCFECHNREHFKKEPRRRWRYENGVLICEEDNTPL